MRYGRILATLVFFAMAHLASAQSETIPAVEEEQVHVNLYPNPAINYLYIRFDSLKSEHVNLTVRNIIGNEMNPDRENVEQDAIRLKVDNFPPGYYLVTLSDENSRFKRVYKFLKR